MFYSVVGPIMVALLSSSAAAASDAASDRIASSMQELQRFRVSHSLADLRSAVSMMEGIVDIRSITPESYVEGRRGAVEAWAQILKTIEQAYDPVFDPTQMIVCPEPHRKPGELPAASSLGCVDPKTIRDPSARAQYTTALAAYNLWVKRSKYFEDVRMLDRRATVSLEMTLNLLATVAPAGTPSDYPALDGILANAALSDVRRTEIDAMFRDPCLSYVTLSGQSIKGLEAALPTTLEDSDVALASQSVMVSENSRDVDIWLARGEGDVLQIQYDKSTGAVHHVRKQPNLFATTVALSVLDVKALTTVYDRLLSGALSVLPPGDDLRSANFKMQERNFDRSHKLPKTNYFVAYLPQTVPAAASGMPCGYLSNYRVDSATWKVVVEPLNC